MHPNPDHTDRTGLSVPHGTIEPGAGGQAATSDAPDTSDTSDTGSRADAASPNTQGPADLSQGRADPARNPADLTRGRADPAQDPADLTHGQANPTGSVAGAPSSTSRHVTPAGGPPRPGTDGKAFAVLATAQFLVVLNTSIVNVALPSIRTGLDLSPTGMSWVVNAYGLAFGALLLAGGQLTDVLGARRILLIGLSAFAAASLAAGLAPTAPLLIAARAVQGAGAALLAPAALALVLRHHPTRLGVWGGVSGAGGAAGVLLGGLLTGTLGWQAIFLVTVPVTIAAIGATRLLVPRDSPTGGRLDVTGAVTATGGLVALTYGLTAPDPVLPVALAAILLTTFLITQRRAKSPVLRTFTTTGRANTAMAVLGAVWVSLFYFLPLYQQQVLGYPPLVAGLAQLPLAGAVVLGSAFAPRLPRRALPVALTALAAGLAWFATGPAFPFDVLGPSLLTGAGLGVAFVHLTVDATRVPTADAGVAGGLVNTSRQVGGAIGLAALVATTTGFAAAFTATAVLAAVAAVPTLRGAQR